MIMVDVTSVEQSKKLLELGVNPNSTDMWWNYDVIDKFGMSGYTAFPSCEKLSDLDVPAWSFSALFKLMPKEIEEVKGHAVELMIGKPKGHCNIMYFDWTGLQHGPEFTDDNLVCAAYKTVTWLLEKKYL